MLIASNKRRARPAQAPAGAACINLNESQLPGGRNNVAAHIALCNASQPGGVIKLNYFRNASPEYATVVERHHRNWRLTIGINPDAEHAANGMLSQNYRR